MLFLQAGVIAAGLADGMILVWDAAKVIGSPVAPAADGAGTFSSKLTKHNGPVIFISMATNCKTPPPVSLLLMSL